MPFGEGAELDDLDALVADFVNSIEPAERRKLGMRMAAELRKANAQRQRAQVEPDGEAFVPRKKNQRRRTRDRVTRLKRRVKAKKMFLRAGGAGYLRKQATASEARVGYVGAMARIMGVHQEGQVDRVSRKPGAPLVKYPRRQVLGISTDDRVKVLELIVEQLGG